LELPKSIEQATHSSIQKDILRNVYKF